MELKPIIDRLARRVGLLEDYRHRLEQRDAALVQGWLAANEPWSYASASTVTAPGDVRGLYPIGTKVKLVQDGVQKYFYVARVALSADVTTLTLIAGSDYSLTNTAITDNAFSYTSTPQGFPVYFSERLTAARTYYVRTDGNDANTGLANSAGGAFLTIQKAVDTIATLDINGQTVTVQVANGTYTTPVVLKAVVGFAAVGNLIVQGDNSTPANVVVSVNGNCFYALGVRSCVWQIQGMTLQNTNGNCLVANFGSYIRFGSIVFGASTYSHISVENGTIESSGNYSISGGSYTHYNVSSNGVVYIQSRTVTLLANVAFGIAFAYTKNGAALLAHSNTYNLGAFAVTGARYSVVSNGVIDTNSAGDNYFPGNSAGVKATGGQYV